MFSSLWGVASLLLCPHRHSTESSISVRSHCKHVSTAPASSRKLGLFLLAWISDLWADVERKAQISLFYVCFHFQTLKRKCKIPSCALLASWLCSLHWEAGVSEMAAWLASGPRKQAWSRYCLSCDGILVSLFPASWKAAHTKAKNLVFSRPQAGSREGWVRCL